MFDLFRSRATAVRIMLGAILGVVSLSMLVYLIPGTGISGTDTNGDQVVADVGKSAVTVDEVQQSLKNYLQSSRVPPEFAATLIPQLVDQAIADRAVAYEAQQLGFRISDRDLAQALRSFPFGTLPPDQYQQYVQQNFGTTVPVFEENVRLKAYEDSIENIVAEGTIVTPAEAEAEYRKANEKIKIDYIGFSPTKLMADIKPTPEELSAYFDKNKSFYTIPETRHLQLIVADQAKVADTIQITDAQIQAYYDAHKDEYRTQERVHARHILLSITNKSKDEVAENPGASRSARQADQSGRRFRRTSQEVFPGPRFRSKRRRSGLGFPRPDGQEFRRRRLLAEAQ